MGFARGWGCGGIVVVNLFAYRATDPRTLFDVHYRREIGDGKWHNGDPDGPDNDRHIRDAVGQCSPVIAAWGVHGVMMGRDRQVGDWSPKPKIKLRCLGLTKEALPTPAVHPQGDAEPVEFGGAP